MRHIYITSDFLMTSGEEQDNNIRWVYDFISRPIEIATSYDANVFPLKSGMF